MPYIPYSKIDIAKRKNKWNVIPRRCPICMKKFDTRSPHKMYCSMECRRREAERKRRAKKNYSRKQT